MKYLSTPYSHPDPIVEEQRFRKAAEIAGRLMNQGLIMFSPISHCHPIKQEVNLPGTWDFWSRLDYHYIDLSDEVIVAKMDGWDKSRGVKAEIAYAKSTGKPVSYVDENGNFEIPRFHDSD